MAFGEAFWSMRLFLMLHTIGHLTLRPIRSFETLVISYGDEMVGRESKEWRNSESLFSPK